MTEKHDEKKVLCRADFCDTAKAIITTDRNQQYGELEDNFAVIAELWSTYISHLYPASDFEIELHPSDVALMMTLFKIGRACTALESKDDTFIDAIGYLACAGEIESQLREIVDGALEAIRKSAEIDAAMESLAEASGRAYRAIPNDEKIADSVDKKLNMHGNGEKPHICATCAIALSGYTLGCGPQTNCATCERFMDNHQCRCMAARRNESIANDRCPGWMPPQEVEDV